MAYEYESTGYTGQGGDMAAGIGKGIQDSVNNLFSIRSAKQNLEQGKKRFDLDMKIENLKLQQLEGQIDPQYLELTNSLNKKKAIALNKQMDYLLAINEMAEKGETEKLKTMQTAYNTMSSISGFNPKTMDFGTTAKEERLQKQAEFSNATKLRGEFLNRPEVKEYVNIETQVRSMEGLLNSAKAGNMENKAALDQGLITMFNKLTDPNSVVRESEYARTPENLPLINRFSGAIQKVKAGGAGLTNSDREALVWGAKVIADQRGITFNRTLKGYEDLAERYGIDTDVILRGMTQHENFIKDTGGAQHQDDIRSRYNAMRELGISSEEAKKRLGL